MRGELRLIDTSMWTHALRQKGDPARGDRVRDLVRTGRAAWCDPIRLELWRGVGSQADRDVLESLEADLTKLSVDTETWDLACRYAAAGRANGLQFPPIDLLIFACARQHGVAIECHDKHFEQLQSLKIR